MAMHCPQCGTDLPAAGSSPLDLCPKCLLSAALSAEVDACPYHIVAPIAESRTGTTYLAQPKHGRGIVALKLFCERDDADDVLARYERLRPMLARVNHPSIARLLEVGLTDEGVLYAASHFVPGWQLSAIDDHKSVDRDARVEIARQLTAAVSAIQGAGLAHLGIDVSNVRVSTANGLRATLLGFGVRMIVDGLAASPGADRDALAQVLHRIGVPPSA
jgi:serine/threonine-protein kinase